MYKSLSILGQSLVTSILLHCEHYLPDMRVSLEYREYWRGGPAAWWLHLWLTNSHFLMMAERS
jgi:hypothetical protein